jgi:hypothetical protein
MDRDNDTAVSTLKEKADAIPGSLKLDKERRSRDNLIYRDDLLLHEKVTRGKQVLSVSHTTQKLN